MTVYELSRAEMEELKERYMIKLVDEGTFAEIMGKDYDEPNWGDMADADELVSDDVIYKEYECYEFGMDDFFCNQRNLEEDKVNESN